MKAAAGQPFLIRPSKISGITRHSPEVSREMCEKAGSVFHPVRGDMFIDHQSKPLRLSSEERNNLEW